MRLYLARHGEASSAAVDPAKGLCEPGRLKIQNMATFLASSNQSVNNVYHSGITRAEETAQILAEKLAPKAELQVLASLEPNDEVDDVVQSISLFSADTLIVGHLPYLNRLLSFLVVNDESSLPVIFNPGTMVCLYKTGIGLWAIEWILDSNLF